LVDKDNVLYACLLPHSVWICIGSLVFFKLRVVGYLQATADRSSDLCFPKALGNASLLSAPLQPSFQFNER